MRRTPANLPVHEVGPELSQCGRALKSETLGAGLKSYLKRRGRQRTWVPYLSEAEQPYFLWPSPRLDFTRNTDPIVKKKSKI